MPQQQTPERMQQLQQMLQRAPNDTFLLYAIALEHKKAGEYPQALEFLHKVLEHDPAYCVAHHQAAQVHELAGNLDAARQAYRAGIDAATRHGDPHARDEMAAALAMIE